MYMPEVLLEFVECDTCRAKSGTPVLCNGCLSNRFVINRFLSTAPVSKIDRQHLDALSTLIQPLIVGGRTDGMTRRQCRDSIYSWDRARGAKDA